MPDDLLTVTDAGLYCPAGDFHIDPWQPVERAVITHAHGDHARVGSRRYLTAASGRIVLQTRLGTEAVVDSLEYGESLSINGVRLSLHPAGHVLGSAQVRVEHAGQVWVVSGDYKLAADATCAAMDPVRCDVFITESTFGLPIYRWQPQQVIFDEINAWWRANAEENRPSIVYAYSLGKAQRVLAGVDDSIGPIFCHGAVQRLNDAYRRSGVALPPTLYASRAQEHARWRRSLIVAPPSARGTLWLRRFGDHASAFVSGWMQLRGARRRRAVERGFVLSDHADWPGLLQAIEATGAGRVRVTHGSTGVMVRWLTERGLQADAIATRFEGELDETADASDAADADEADEATGSEATP
jgi:putative mRNA 3-end processing factor